MPFPNFSPPIRRLSLLKVNFVKLAILQYFDKFEFKFEVAFHKLTEEASIAAQRCIRPGGGRMAQRVRNPSRTFLAVLP